MKYLKHLSLIISLSIITALFGSSVALASPVASTMMPSRVVAAATESEQDACAGLSQLDSSDNCTTKGNSVVKLIKVVVQILSIMIGIISVLVIMFAGFRYVISGGDSASTNSARNMLIYAIIGLVIAILAQFIAVHVLNTADNIKNAPPAKSSYLNSENKSDYVS